MRRVLRIGPGRLHLLIAALVIATIPLGLIFGALAQLAVCLLLLQPLWLWKAVSPSGIVKEWHDGSITEACSMRPEMQVFLSSTRLSALASSFVVRRCATGSGYILPTSCEGQEVGIEAV